jgi:glycosyltransferase involved in cell wall biosynthesis
LLELRPEVVHCWLDYSNVRVGLAAVIAGVPRVILSGRNVSPTHFPYIHEPFMRAAYRVLAEQPGVLLANNSRGGADDYAAWLGLPDSRFRVVYNGVDLGAMERASLEEIARLRQSLGLSEKAFVVGGLFRFSDEKRPLLWLETAARVVQMRPDVGFLLFGAGPRLPDMELYLDRSGLGDRVKLAPPTSQNALALSSFDLLLLASQWEGTPNVVIEAQAVGTPVIVAGGGGAREALEPDVTGLFIENADAGALAQAVCDLLGDPVRRGAMAAAGPAFVRARFSLERMVTDTVEGYGLAQPGPPRPFQPDPAASL